MGIRNKISPGYAYYLTMMDYVPNNSVKVELVANPEDYLYSSARVYTGEKGLVASVLGNPLAINSIRISVV